MTLEKIVYQLELCSKSLQLLEMRVMDSENKMQHVTDWIRTSDIEYVSQIRFYHLSKCSNPKLSMKF